MMNERIRELAERAGLKQRIWNSLGKELPMWQEDPDNPGLAKFAELIVQEAMTVTKTYTSNQGLDYSAPVALARHFGVGQ